MDIRSFRDLAVWQRSMELVEQCYRITKSFPSEEKFGLSSQLQRAAVSVPANIAEGRSRGRTKEFLHHLSIASGSLAEVETHLEVALRLRYLAESVVTPMFDRITSIARMMNSLQASLRKRLK